MENWWYFLYITTKIEDYKKNLHKWAFLESKPELKASGGKKYKLVIMCFW